MAGKRKPPTPPARKSRSGKRPPKRAPRPAPRAPRPSKPGKRKGKPSPRTPKRAPRPAPRAPRKPARRPSKPVRRPPPPVKKAPRRAPPQVKKPAPRKPRKPVRRKPVRGQLPRIPRVPKQPKYPKPPRGFKPPGRTAAPGAGGPRKFAPRNPFDVKHQIDKLFVRVGQQAKGMHKLDSTLYSHMNADDSISTHYRIDGWPARPSLDRMMRDLGTLFTKTAVAGAWLSIGFVMAPPERGVMDAETRDRYNRDRRGFSRTFVYWRRWQKEIVPLIFQAGRRQLRNLRKTFKRAPAAFFIWSYWHPSGRRPPRKGAKNG